MTIQEYAASAIEKSVEDLIKAAMVLPEEKREWQPLGKGRSALSQLAECAVINGISTQVIKTGIWSAGLPVMTGSQVAALDTPVKAVIALREETTALVHAIRAVADADLMTEIMLPWARTTLVEFFQMPLWNMSYHEGQITYIEALTA